jgi:predicted Ser/Thr protein kinase
MTQANWTRLKALFNGALEQPASDRERWLRHAAAGDLELLHEAQALIEAHETAGDFLEQPIEVAADDIAALAPGATIGPYHIVEELGHGGMGVVYLAEDRRLGRQVALKALPTSAAADPDYRERLRREARAAATISHHAVAVVYALEEIDDQLFIASEYVRGRTLRSELAQAPFTEQRACTIAAEIARALVAAHAAGVIHRDLKPENVLLTDAGGVKVVDFGIAQIEGVDLTRLTREGAIVGTPAYMAPEQLAGSLVDARADIYAAGVVIAEMVDGRTTSLAAVIERCVQRDPERRYASARELLHALEGKPAPDRWWWEFHQAMAALTYWLMVIAAWRARVAIGGVTGRVLFITILGAVIVAANLRLHLWFTSRFYPGELRWLRARVRRWIHAADWVFCLGLVAGALLLGDNQSPLAVLLLSFGIGAAVAFLVIEPATARAAFRDP